MIIGSGPIIIGQAAEFDFSGSQACRALREEGYEVVLVNSNPATIQTDLEMADIVYLEPLIPEIIEKIIKQARPKGLLAGMGGQTALNLCAELGKAGVLEKYGVELLGTPLKAIEDSEDRDLFRATMLSINEPIPKSIACNSLEEVKEAIKSIGGYPVIIRPAYTLGGTGSGIVERPEDLEEVVTRGLNYSRIKQVLVEECVTGWAEFEYEVMRDQRDNCITICNMENLDPMGIHTGESIVIAPAQTLSDKDHQILRSASLKIIRALGIAGGCNIQFALNQTTGEYRVIEVNPRVSRSSALASKATGYPIARVAAKIAVGLTLDEIPNSVTGKTYAGFEPALDYVVIKIPRWPFDKFRTADKRIGTQMKSTGEVMAIGRVIEEALGKAVRSLEIDRIAFEPEHWSSAQLIAELVEPTDQRLIAIAEAIRRGYKIDTIVDLTKWHPFFVHKMLNIIRLEQELTKQIKQTNRNQFNQLNPFIEKELLWRAKRYGFSDEYLAWLLDLKEEEIRNLRKRHSIVPTYKMVDTCAAEFAAETPYFYSTYEQECEASLSSENALRAGVETSETPNSEFKTPNLKKVLIIGSGPIRIGQGIEFDYCCVHGVMALREAGIKALIINNNPETVSTDYDVSDRLYFEPLTLEDVLNVIENERPGGVILQFGGQTAVNLAIPLQDELSRRPDLTTKILGTSPEFIDLAEDRKRFETLLAELDIKRPQAGTGYSFAEVETIATQIGYPVLVRPSYVLGGKGMEIVQNAKELEWYMGTAVKVSRQHPVLVDKYLSHAIELDVDAISDGRDVFIGGIMEHIEEAGVHSGDAACVLPPQTLTSAVLNEVRRITREITLRLQTIGLINIQLAVKDGVVYILEANPRASRTVPFVSKTIGIPLAKIATLIMLGKSLSELGLVDEAVIQHPAVKVPVFPFQKLAGVDPILGPEMKSTGEVMGIAPTFAEAYYKGLLAAGMGLPSSGQVYVTVCDSDKEHILPLAGRLISSGFKIVATKGTAVYLREHGIDATTVWRISEKQAPNALTLMREGKIQLIINTPTEGSGPKRDGYRMRRLAVELGIPFITTISAARAATDAIALMKGSALEVQSLNELIQRSAPDYYKVSQPIKRNFILTDTKAESKL
jgi:carbamoyl-phosphate synthase large subunit